MRILFVMRHPQYVRNYESTIEALALRGHAVHVGFTPLGAETGPPVLAERLAAEHANVTFGPVPGRTGLWVELVKLVRSLRDRLRYQHEDFRACPQLTKRASLKAETATRWLTRWLASDTTPRGVARWNAVLRGIEHALPPAPPVVETLERWRPDVVLVTPMVDLGSQQRDYVKAARALGIPSALCVASWDNLTNKGLMQTLPDRVFLWNEHQRGEAVRYHEVTAEQVVVTGAQCYDHWFERQPATSRAHFCRRAGLPGSERYVAYLSSSKFIAPREADFVARWIQSLRDSGDPRLNQTTIVVRPHPGNPQDWSVVDRLNDPRVAVWPRDGEAVHGEEARSNYFDTFYHAAAAVGVNTSAMVEAGIAGCVCHTIRLPEFAGTQDGTLHFAHLLRGGYVRAAQSLEEHHRQLSATLRDPQAAQESLDRFLGDFIRPLGLDQAATPRLVEAIERMPREIALAPQRASFAQRLARAALTPVAVGLIGVRGAVSVSKAQAARDKAPPCPPSYRGWHWPAASRVARASSPAPTQGSGLGSHARQVARYLENAVWQPHRVARALRRAAAGEGPLVLGPWLSEVGFELLYWIPMMRHYLRAYGIAPSRVIAVSRGGVASWYRGLADRYVEIFDLLAPEEFHQRNESREGEAGGKKQIRASSMDHAILAAAARQAGVENPAVLHPHLMYQLMRGFWRGRFPLSFVEGHCDFSPLSTDDAAPLELPFDGPFYTAKFYYSSCFPETRANAALVSRLLRGLARRRPVVLLGTGLKVDDHDDWQGDEAHNVYSARPWLTAQNNLAVQSALVARSSGLYCTYGGFSYLAPMLGRPVTSIYSEQNFVPSHLQLAESAFNAGGQGRFAAAPAEALARWLDDLAAPTALRSLPREHAA